MLVGLKQWKIFASVWSSKVSRKHSTGKGGLIRRPKKLLNGEQEARIIAARLGPPPKGYAHWTLRLLARKVVELEIVESVSRETVRRTLTHGKRVDYEYERAGTANIFMFTEPLAGWR